MQMYDYLHFFSVVSTVLLFNQHRQLPAIDIGYCENKKKGEHMLLAIFTTAT